MAHGGCMDQSFISNSYNNSNFNSESGLEEPDSENSEDKKNYVSCCEKSAATSTDYNNCLNKYPTEDILAVNSYKDTTEGQQGDVSKELNCSYSCGFDLFKCGSLSQSLASSSKNKKTNMERVSDHSPYSSDQWEDSDHSDTDGDHSDSSDDDDPKSQVDRLIERGTLMFMDDENSALSSESETDDSDYEDDSESDITDVSPLISATASPIGLSPVLPRRTLATSPLALHHSPRLSNVSHTNTEHQGWTNQLENQRPIEHTPESTDMALLVQAVIELEKKGTHKKRLRHRANLSSTTQVQHIHPIHDSPHHRHLSRKNPSRRKNMSFPNDEVRRIDRDNKILLKKIMAAHSRTKTHHSSNHHNLNSNHQNHHTQNRPTYLHKPANATINRKKDDEKIRRDNLILLRKIQEVKPSKDVVEARSPRHRHGSSTYLRSAPAGSCSMSARATHVTAPPPRKETAL